MVIESIARDIIATTKDYNNGIHFYSLMGERPAGSQWGGKMTQDILLHWIMEGKRVPLWELDASLTASGCAYIRIIPALLRKTFPNAEANVIPSHCVRGQIDVRDGAHGKELVCREWHRSAFINSDDNQAWIILGPLGKEDNKEIGIHTLFPGPLTPPLPKDWDGDIKSLDLRKGYAVKPGLLESPKEMDSNWREKKEAKMEKALRDALSTLQVLSAHPEEGVDSNLCWIDRSIKEIKEAING